MGQKSPEADRLRAQALSALGRHAAAAALYAALGEQDQSLSQAWRAGDWTRLAEAGDDTRAAMSDVARQSADPTAGALPEEPGRLVAETAPRLVSASADTRGRIEALLGSLAQP